MNRAIGIHVVVLLIAVICQQTHSSYEDFKGKAT